jgi:hypothetical protein
VANVIVDFDARNNILRATVEGRLTSGLLLDFHAAATAFVVSEPPCRALVDLSRVTEFEVSTDAIRQVAAHPPLWPSISMRVLVIQKDVIYGVARMFQILTENTYPGLHLVRTMSEAYGLLQAVSPEFVPYRNDPRPPSQEPEEGRS